MAEKSVATIRIEEKLVSIVDDLAVLASATAMFEHSTSHEVARGLINGIWRVQGQVKSIIGDLPKSM